MVLYGILIEMTTDVISPIKFVYDDEVDPNDFGFLRVIEDDYEEEEKVELNEKRLEQFERKLRQFLRKKNIELEYVSYDWNQEEFTIFFIRMIIRTEISPENVGNFLIDFFGDTEINDIWIQQGNNINRLLEEFDVISLAPHLRQ